jgi:hypothetical protein
MVLLQIFRGFRKKIAIYASNLVQAGDKVAKPFLSFVMRHSKSRMILPIKRKKKRLN